MECINGGRVKELSYILVLKELYIKELLYMLVLLKELLHILVLKELYMKRAIVYTSIKGAVR